MDNLTPEELQDFYNSLPEDLQSAIFSPESMEVYNQIQARYALDAAQREELSIQSGLLMMGITEPKEYVLVLAEKLRVPRDKAAFIAQEVNRNILHPVRESLKEIHQISSDNMSSNTPTGGGVASQSIPREVPIPLPPSVATTFDQKLGQTFRVATPPQAEVPNYGVAPSQEIRVAPPQTPPPTTPRASDPYRETPL